MYILDKLKKIKNAQQEFQSTRFKLSNNIINNMYY